jgi:hypothetical protein
MLKIVTDDTDRYDLAGSLDELVAAGALRMLMAGLEIEVADYVERHQGLVDEAGRRVVVRNGRAAERTLVTGAGALKVRAPRVHDRREGLGSRRTFCPAMRAGLRRSLTCCRCCICGAS